MLFQEVLQTVLHLLPVARHLVLPALHRPPEPLRVEEKLRVSACAKSRLNNGSDRGNLVFRPRGH